MLGQLEEVTVLGVSHLVVSALSLVFIIRFSVFELNFYGLSSLCRKKFVSITFFGNIGFLVNSLSRGLGWLIYQYKVVNAIPSSGIALVVIGYFAFSASLAAHVALVFLRSKAVFETSTSFLKGMRYVVVLFYVVVYTTAFLASWDLIYHSTASFLAFRTFSFLSMCSIGFIDVVSTISFIQYIQQMNSLNDNKKTSFISNQVHVKQTDRIAQRSAVTCFLASTGLAFYIAGAVAAIFVPSLTAEPVVVIQQFFFLTVMTLWMKLKMELDKIALTKESFVMLTSNSGDLLNPKVSSE
jgi:hypothetical protein